MMPLVQHHNDLRESFGRGAIVDYLYASILGGQQKLVATFDSDQQTLAYVNWATLKTNADGTRQFEQGSVLAGYQIWSHTESPLTDLDSDEVFHNPSPNML